MMHPNVRLVQDTYKRLTGESAEGKLLYDVECTVLPELVRLSVVKHFRSQRLDVTVTVGDLEEADR